LYSIHIKAELVERLLLSTESSDDDFPLWLIPAGDYRSPEYYRKLNKLDWNLIFSEKRNGVAFFQEFLAKIDKELQPDVVIVDSRTGIGEIAGLCTQQLADEVVMLSSLSSESIEMTRHIGQIIRQSEVAKALGKSIDIKIIVSRVPKPENLEAFKKRCCELFEVDETKLFFLFSCPTLELEEFLAIANPGKEQELVADYVRLFYGLNIELADQSIQAEIERTSRKLLSISSEESENEIVELVALYPHPEVYRAAMRFFRLVKRTDEMRNFGWKLLDFVPCDKEAQRVLAKSYLTERWLHNDDTIDAIRAIEPLWKREELSHEEIVRYADFLEAIKRYSESLDIAFPLCTNEQLDDDTQVKACSIAVRTALKLDQPNVAAKLITSIEETGDLNKAFEVTKQVLARGITSEFIQEKAYHLANQLNRVKELEEAIESYIPF